jgi:hypothetical protein
MLNAVLVVLLSELNRFLANDEYVVFGSQQSTTSALPGADWKPAGQFVHCTTPLAEYVSGAHTSHAAEPVAFLNVPAAQAGHGPPFGPVNAGLQKQLLRLVLATDEFEFAGQLVHASLPFVGLYVPAAHVEHWPLEAPLSGPV